MVALDSLIIQSICTAAVAHFGTSRDPWKLQFINGKVEKKSQNRIKQFINSKRYYIMISVLIGFLAVAMQSNIPNHYQILNVPIGCPKHLIQHQFRQLTKQFHPDRIASVNDYSEDEKEHFKNSFFKLQVSYETLINDVRRQAYEKFGDFNQKGELLDGNESGISMVTLALAFQILCFAIGYFATMPKRFQDARMYFVLFNVGMFCIELHLRFLDSAQKTFIFWPFRGLVAFEKVELCKRLFPVVLGLSMIISDAMFSDESIATLQLLHGVVLTNRLICQKITELTGSEQPESVHSKNILMIYERWTKTNCQSDGNKHSSGSINAQSIDAARTFGKLNTVNSKEANGILEQQSEQEARLSDTSNTANNEQPTTHQVLGFSINQLVVFAIMICAAYIFRR